ncbi:MAG: hypothetical protein JWO62_3771 [Acidimicrobiaceae bacterium]|jgi:uncharacterized protein with PQ loop repeat|nr:hypothetical protein [Acidimicrobiaceae bacterium]
MVTVARGIPQVVRLFRAEPDGVSVLTWQLWMVLGEPWIAYGILQHVPAEVVTNCCTTVLALLTLVLVTRSTGTTARTLAISGVSSVAVVVFILVSVRARDLGIISTVAVVGSITMYIPQAIRTFRSGSLAGVSPWTWAMALGTAMGWGVYGALIHQLPVWLPSVITVPTAAVIVAKLRAVRVGSAAEVPAAHEVEALV